MIAEVARSPSRPRTYLVNPRYADIGGTRCLPDLADVPGPVDLVLLAVPDTALAAQLGTAARSQDRSAVIFGSAFDPPSGPAGLRDRLAATAASAGMAVCGAGCIGFVNVTRGLRAIGYVEPDPPLGPVALITHSGSVFSAMLRARRGFGFSLAVSSGEELVTTAAAYARYALGLAQTKVLALVLEAIRDAPDLRAVLAQAQAADVPVVLLSVGASDAELALGLVRDASLGPLVVVSAGGVLIEIFPNGPWCFLPSPARRPWPSSAACASPPSWPARAASPPRTSIASAAEAGPTVP